MLSFLFVCRWNNVFHQTAPPVFRGLKRLSVLLFVFVVGGLTDDDDDRIMGRVLFSSEDFKALLLFR